MLRGMRRRREAQWKPQDVAVRYDVIFNKTKYILKLFNITGAYVSNNMPYFHSYLYTFAA